MDPRPGASLGRVNVEAELAAPRAGSEPNWERVWHGGVDVSDKPEAWTPYERARRLSFEERVELYRAEGLV